MDRLLYYMWFWPKEELKFFWRHRITKVTFRLRNGFWPNESWNLDVTFAKYILPRLKHFRACTHGYPSDLTEETWNRYLDEMIVAFDWVANRNYYDVPMQENGTIDSEAYDKLLLDTQHGLGLFAKYYMGLWY